MASQQNMVPLIAFLQTYMQRLSTDDPTKEKGQGSGIPQKE
jgi:hypothetical protein